jgi:DNA processing protein
MSDPFTFRTVYWVWLNELRGISLRTKRMLLTTLGDPEAVFHASLDDITGLLVDSGGTFAEAVHERPGMQSLGPLWSQRNLKQAESILTTHDAHGIETLCAADWRYQRIFAHDRHAPLVLYYRGKLAEPEVPVVGITGTRSCTSYGRKVTKAAVRETVAKGEVVASGLSFGIEALAHETTLSLRGTTYAFLPCGLHRAQPSSHEKLMERIIAQGAVISPYPHGKEALPFRFIGRNDLLAAWCDPLLVVEARLKSGCMHTARRALAKGKRVFAAPNSLLKPKSSGTNQLLSEGAQVYLNDHLLENIDSRKSLGRVEGERVRKIINVLTDKPLGTGELVSSVGQEATMVMESLAAMEDSEQVEYRSDGKWHRVGGP